MKDRIFVLAHDQAKANAAAAMSDPAYAGHVVTISPPAQSDIQREKYHAMVADIAKHEKTFDKEVWKRLLIDQFKAETNNDDFPRLREYWRRNEIRIMPSLDRKRVITLGEQSREFPIFVASAFIEFLYATGADWGVRWSEPAEVPHGAE